MLLQSARYFGQYVIRLSTLLRPARYYGRHIVTVNTLLWSTPYYAQHVITVSTLLRPARYYGQHVITPSTLLRSARYYAQHVITPSTLLRSARYYAQHVITFSKHYHTTRYHGLLLSCSFCLLRVVSLALSSSSAGLVLKLSNVFRGSRVSQWYCNTIFNQRRIEIYPAFQYINVCLSLNTDCSILPKYR